MNVEMGITICVITFFVLVFFLLLAGKLHILRPIEDGTDFLKSLYESGREKPIYVRKSEWLTQKGAGFHFGNWMTPYTFYGLRVALTVVGVIIGRAFGLVGALLFGIGLWELPVFLIWVLNRGDNRRLLVELKLLYHSLEIQIRAGVYVTDALAEAYGVVREKRLRQALLNLAGEIVMEGKVYEALDHFRRQFDNEQINVLCVILIQALETGQAVELIREMENQIKDMEALVRQGKKQALDRSITFYQLGILIAMLAVVLYSCISGMLSAAWFI